jgi:hypothetical protein
LVIKIPSEASEKITMGILHFLEFLGGYNALKTAKISYRLGVVFLMEATKK